LLLLFIPSILISLRITAVSKNMPHQQNNPVGRPKLNLFAWQTKIEEWREASWSYEDMRIAIQQESGTAISLATFKRRLHEMGIQTRFMTEDTLELRTRVAYIFSALRLNDVDTVDILERDGFKVNVRGLGRLRRKIGLKKRTQQADFEEVNEHLRSLLRLELDTNNISGFGEGHLYTYMRSKYNVIGK
jgi:hypothetical protein